MFTNTLPYFRRASWLAIMALAAVMLLAACDDDGNGDGDTADPTTTAAATDTPAECGGDTATPSEAATEDGGAAGAGGTIEVGYVPGWDEGVASTYLWEHMLEEQGYEVELTELDIAALFAGIAG